MSALGVVRASARRSWLKTLRRPVPLTFSFVQPLMWMGFFGFLFHRFELGPAYATLRYLDFLLPGVCAMTVLFGASQAGIEVVRDLQTGFAQRMSRSTGRPGALLAGKLAADVSRLLLQAAVVALLGVLLGARLSPAAGPVLLAGLGLALFAAAYAALSVAIALATGAQEGMAVFVHLVNMPLLFTSTALVPARQMPDWLEGVARWNPLSRVADALREALLFGRAPEAAPLLVPLALLAAALFLLARRGVVRAAAD